MIDKFGSNKIQDSDYTHNNQETDYKNLITKLKEISSKIAILEKKILK